MISLPVLRVIKLERELIYYVAMYLPVLRDIKEKDNQHHANSSILNCRERQKNVKASLVGTKLANRHQQLVKLHDCLSSTVDRKTMHVL